MAYNEEYLIKNIIINIIKKAINKYILDFKKNL